MERLTDRNEVDRVLQTLMRKVMTLCGDDLLRRCAAIRGKALRRTPLGND